MCELLLDTDVLIKLAAYGLFDAIDHPGCEVGCSRMVGIVGAAKFTARAALARKAQDPELASSSLEAFILRAEVLEPTAEEILLAAELEEAASLAGGSLDVGESLLCAIAIGHDGPTVLTGDKRAIAAAEQLIAEISGMRVLAEKIACLEQAISLATERLGATVVRDAVLTAPKTDIALSICFQVTRPTVPDDFYPTGLGSYIEHLRAVAPTVLLPGQVLTTI